MNASPSLDTSLLADIGGTNTRFALSIAGCIRYEVEYRCQDHVSLVAATLAYLETLPGDVQRPTQGAIAMAGPVNHDLVTMTNHPWTISVRQTREQLKLSRLIVLNDFTALAMAIPALPQESLTRLGGDMARLDAPIALIGPGTGLGVSALIPSNGNWLPLQGEGGHVALSAVTNEEFSVLSHLQTNANPVSAETLLSGPGLVRLYQALCAVRQEKARFVTPAQVTANAISAEDAICVTTLEMFCAFLGTVASDLVLTLGAYGGLYIGGGIVPKLDGYFERSGFRERFDAHVRYHSLLKSIPAYVIHAPHPAFLGLQRAFTSPGPRVESIT